MFLLNQEEDKEAIVDILQNACQEICQDSLPAVHFQKKSRKSYNLATTLQNKIGNLENRDGRSIIFVIDRGIDMVTPFMHDISLEPLSYDILQLDDERNEFPKFKIQNEFQFNLQKSKDILWQKIRDIEFFKVYKVLKSKEQVTNLKNQNILKREILKELELVEFTEDLKIRWNAIFQNKSLDLTQLNVFQVIVSSRISAIKNAKFEEEFPKHKKFLQKLSDKVDKFKDIIDLIKLQMSKSNQQTITPIENKDEEVPVSDWIEKLHDSIEDFITYIGKIQTAERDLDAEIFHLLETTQKLPKLLKAKKLLSLYQTMLLDLYKEMEKRNIKQCSNIEEALFYSEHDYIMDGGIAKHKKDMVSFVSAHDNFLEDKLRLLLIFFISNNLSRSEIHEIMTRSKISEDKIRIVDNLEKHFEAILNTNQCKIWCCEGKKSPFIKLLAENYLIKMSNPGICMEMFESVIDEKKLRRVNSLNFHDIKNVIFYITGFITHSEISVVRSLNKISGGCKFFLGSNKIHTARSLINYLDY